MVVVWQGQGHAGHLCLRSFFRSGMVRQKHSCLSEADRGSWKEGPSDLLGDGDHGRGGKIDVTFCLKRSLVARIFRGFANPVFSPSRFLIFEKRALQLEVSRQTPNTCSYFQISVNLVIICSLRL